MALITLNKPKFKTKTNGTISSDGYKWTSSTSNYYFTITGATYNTATKQLAVTIQYNRTGSYYVSGVYMSLNNDRTSLGNSANYQSVSTSGSTYGSTGPGEFYYILHKNSGGTGKAVQINPNTSGSTSDSATGKTIKTILTTEGGDINGQHLANTITGTIYATVEPNALSSVPIYIKLMYSSNWKGVNSSDRWLNYTSSYTKSIGQNPGTLGTDSTIITYTLSYNANGGSSTPSSVSALQDQTITLASAIGHTSVPSTGTITISYNANGGSGAPGNSTGTYTNTTTYTFNKWTYNGSNYNAGGSFTMPASNVTMTASWSTNTSRTSNPSITLSSTRPTRNGYTFLGWSESSSATSASYSAGTAYTFSTNKTLYAVWTPAKIKLTLNANGGTVGTSAVWYYYGTSKFYSNEACTTQITAITKPTRTGYTYDQYYGDGTSGGTNNERYIYSDGTFASDLATDIYKNATLYAKWNINSYTFEVYAGNGTYNGSTGRTSYSGNYNTTYSVGLPTPPSGYIFAGYHRKGPLTGVTSSDSIFESGNGGIAVYNNSGNGTVTHTREQDNTVPTKSFGDGNVGYRIKITKTTGTASPGCGGFYLSTTSKANHVFRCLIYAKIPVGYTINDYRNAIGEGGNSTWLTSQAGTGDWFLYVYEVHCGSSGTFSSFGHVALTADDKDNNRAVTWYVCGVQITDITSSARTYTYTENGYVECYYARQEYDVAYNANGGTGAPATQKKIYDITLTLSSTRPTRSNTTSTGYTVTFNGNGGTAGTSSLTATNTTSYSFNNWKATNGTTYNPGGSYTANTATTMTAQWNSTTTNGSVTLPSATRTYYTFSGWSKVAGTSPYYNANTSYTVSSNHNLYANWTPNAPINMSLTWTSATINSITLTYSDAGVVTNRTVYYRKVGDSTYSSAIIQTNPFTITGLDTDTNYEIYYTASNSAASSSTTAQQFSTILSTPIISDYDISVITPFTATAYITAFITPSRTLQYRFSSDNGTTWSAWQNSDNYTHTGLNEETQYTFAFQVKAIHTSVNASDTTSSIYTKTYTTPADQAQVWINDNNTWKHGKSWIKINGAWTKAKKVYIKINDTWVINKNN